MYYYDITAYGVAIIMLLGLIYLFINSLNFDKVLYDYRMLRKLKKGNYPKIFVDWVAYTQKEKSMLRIEAYFFKMRRTFINKNASQYASTAFYDSRFVDAFAKLTTITGNENMKKSFLKEYFSCSTLKDSMVIDTVLTPIEEAMDEYFRLFNEYDKIQEDTALNEIKLLVSQDFSKTYPVEKVDSYVAKGRYVFETFSEE